MSISDSFESHNINMYPEDSSAVQFRGVEKLLCSEKGLGYNVPLRLMQQYHNDVSFCR
jgi:hypothetical protein